MKCIRCGSEVSMSSKFCKNCGTVISKDMVIEEIGSEKTKIPGKVFVWAAGVVLLLLVCSKIFTGTEKKQDISENAYENTSENRTDTELWNGQEEERNDEQENMDAEMLGEGNYGEYILPESNSRYLTKEELYGLSAEQCRIARNEIYARHGRMFNDAGLQAYFESFEWYTPGVAPDNFQESVLNEYEVANRDLIVDYETEQGYR